MIIFNEAKPKYTKLEELLEDQLLDITLGNQVNMIIDTKELARKYFRPDISVDVDNRRNLITEISSDIINIIGHYRNFFFKHGKYSTFYFLYSTKECKLFKDIFSNYKEEYYEKHFGMDPKVEIIRKALEMAQKVINNSIPNAYFIETSDCDEFIYAKYILAEILNKDNELNLVLSNDDMFLQLINNHTFVLTAKGINSELIKTSTVFNEFKADTTLKIGLLPLVFSIGGIKKYSLKSLSGVATLKAITIVEKLVERELVENTDVIPAVFPLNFQSLNPKIKMDNDILQKSKEISELYKVIQGDSILYANKVSIESNLIKTCNITKKPKTFLELNAKIFTLYPLITEMILKGEKI